VRWAAFLLSLAACQSPQPHYPYVTLPVLLGDPGLQAAGQRVMTSGVYSPDGRYERLVRGVLAEGRHSLRLQGEAFDWLPPADARIDVWGVLRRDSQGLYLEFHNARLHGDRTRQPRITPPLDPGAEVELVARIRQVGSYPATWWVAQTEDRVVIRLAAPPPPGVPSGLVAIVRLRIRSAGPLGTLADLLSAVPLPGALPPPPGG
jgi:hypothetical protein